MTQFRTAVVACSLLALCQANSLDTRWRGGMTGKMPKFTHETCREVSTGHLELLDWFFKENYEPDSYREWATQLGIVTRGDYGVRCSEPHPAYDYRRGSEYDRCIFISCTRYSGSFTDDPKDANLSTPYLASAAAGHGLMVNFRSNCDTIPRMLKDMVLKNAVDKSQQMVNNILGSNKRHPDYVNVSSTAIYDVGNTINKTMIQRRKEMFLDGGSKVVDWVHVKQTYDHPVPNFFAQFNYSMDPGGNERQYLDHMATSIGSVGLSKALATANYYVLGDLYPREECNKEHHPSAHWVDGHCYALHSPGPGNGRNTKLQAYTAEASNDAVNGFGQIPLERVYKLSADCQTKYNEYYHKIAFSDISFENQNEKKDDDILASCHFNLPVLYVKPSEGIMHSSPCRMAGGKSGNIGYDYLPKQLEDIFGKKGFCK